MTPLEIGILGVVLMLALLFMGVPVGISMAVVGFGGFAAVIGWHQALGVLRTVPSSTFGSYTLSVIPLFVLMGNFAYHGGLSAGLYGTARAWLGRLPGGLAMATIAGSAGFAALTGSTVATSATMGKMAIPEMQKYRYRNELIAASVASGGTIGTMIPPSILFILYGIMTEQSIGKLFLSGFIPGVMQAILYISMIGVLCYLRPDYGPRAPRSSMRQKLVSLKDSWGTIVIFGVVIGSLYLGVVSTVEAAGLGCFCAFVFIIIQRKLSWRVLRDSLVETIETTAVLFLIMVGANIFAYFLTVSGLTTALASGLGGLAVSRYVILLVVIIIYLILGMMMETMAMVLLTVPIFFPLMMELGFHPIWFGVLVVRMSEIGLITPPVGINLFVLKSVFPDATIGQISRGVLPFIAVDVVHVGLLVAFPIIALLLPQLMG